VRTTESNARQQPDCIEMLVGGVAALYLEIVLLVIDVSISMDEQDWRPSRLRGAKDACIAFVERKVQLRPKDSVGIISFASSARLEHVPAPVGVNLDRLKATVNRLHTAECTNIGAALRKAEDAFNGGTSIHNLIADKGFLAWLFPSNAASSNSCRASADPNQLRRIVLLSDGGHNGSIDPIPAARRLLSSGVEVDCIGIGGSNADVDEGLLKEIASRDEQGRPRYWFIGDRTGLIRKFEHLASSLRCIDS